MFNNIYLRHYEIDVIEVEGSTDELFPEVPEQNPLCGGLGLDALKEYQLQTMSNIHKTFWEGSGFTMRGV